jgi:hypothetical protein
MLKMALVVTTMLGTASVALADSCVDQATAKKLAGAAKTSFLTKCQKDAVTTCDAAAAEKKLSGAAKTSFTKKCVNDAVGQ